MCQRHTVVILEKDTNTLKLIRELVEAINLSPHILLSERNSILHYSESEIAAIIISADMSLKEPKSFIRQFTELDSSQRRWNIPVLLTYSGNEAKALAPFADVPRNTVLRKPLLMNDLCQFLEGSLKENWIDESEMWRAKESNYSMELENYSKWASKAKMLINHFEG